MLIRDAAALLGPDLEYAESVDVRVSRGVFAEVGSGLDASEGEYTMDGRGLLAVPGFVNCHTHVGDSIAKDVATGAGLKRSVHPVFGVKPKVLARTRPAHLARLIEAGCRSMILGGTTTFVDFREGGVRGVSMLREACGRAGLRGIILGRPGAYQSRDHIKNDAVPPGMAEDLGEVAAAADGLGISGANENSDSLLKLYSKVPAMRAIHAAETAGTVAESFRTTGRGEVERALLMRPRFVVHMGHATGAELAKVAEMGIGVVACPRSNAVLGGGIPDIFQMAAAGCVVALGTDNVMVNSPDMFREMEFAWRSSGGRLSPLEVLKMATVNGGRILGMKLGVIAPGYAADYTLVRMHHVDLEPMHDPHAALVHRAGPASVLAVSVGGRIVHGDA